MTEANAGMVEAGADATVPKVRLKVPSHDCRGLLIDGGFEVLSAAGMIVVGLLGSPWCGRIDPDQDRFGVRPDPPR